ncbi:MAG: trypsin-like peptidase domain-containing protein [Planctomycetota bacterium]|jgi:serine protease Do
MTETDKTNEDICARKTLGPWLIAITVLICVTIILVLYYADDIRQSQATRGQMQFGVSKMPRWSGQTGTKTPRPVARLAAFVPPWHGKQNPDAVTGATPRVMSFNRAIGIVSPSVVGINTSGAVPQSASGIIVHSRGYILTNNHVVEGAKNIVVTLSYDQLIKSYSAQVFDTRPALDLAIIKINSTGKELLTPAPLGNSDRVYIGQQVVAIGNPFGLSQSASSGIISNPQRTLTTENKIFDDLIQTDASINPGSSGGALVNPNAEIIGINTAIYSPTQAFSGIGFAIPINQAKRAFPDLIEIVQSPLARKNTQAANGHINQANLPPRGINLQMMAGQPTMKHCWLGISAYPVNSIVARELDLPNDHGVLVNRIFGNSPAAKAGLRRGDVIYRVDLRRIRDEKMLWSLLLPKRAGDTVKITLFRNNTKKTLKVRLEPEPPNIRSLLSKAPLGAAAGAAGEQAIEEISWLGIDIQPIEAGEALQEFGIDPSETGVFVGEVEGIAAIESGVMAGDVIKKVNNQRVKDIESFKDIIKKVDISEGVLLDIVRQRRPFYVSIRPIRQDRGAW